MQYKNVLAMYDVRGIQKYIFRTAKVIDAIGASAIVENIIKEALEYAMDQVEKEEKLQANLEWYDEKGILEYKEYDENKVDVQVLFIGGGNAFVMYRDKELCLKVNRHMAYYTLQNTYSLQLAAAIVEKTNDYSDDYQNLYAEMNKTKADMIVSKPLGTLPVMDVEVKTGYALASETGSTETLLKKQIGGEKQRRLEKDRKLFESYITEKGVDSTIAVVHIDGNSMGSRIRDMISGIKDYKQAVERMRRISYRITKSYEKAFEEMYYHFEKELGEQAEFAKKEKPYMVRKILVAGDDITYVCNGKIALATVEYFCKRIAGCTMNGGNTAEDFKKYGFSVCAGISYIGSHFPFHVGYEVAEACCESAKDFAKQKEHKDGDRVGNFVDFHICKNIQAQSFKDMRKKEYITSSGENLLRRPYYISTDTEGNLERLNKEMFAYDKFKEAVRYFQNSENIPKSFAKELRNTYPLGERQVNLFYSFLDSRDWKMPDETDELYYETENHVKTAKWYDAVELQDYYIDVE